MQSHIELTQPDKGHAQYPTPNNIFNGERMNVFLLRSRTRQECPNSAPPFNIAVDDFDRATEKVGGKEGKKEGEGKGERVAGIELGTEGNRKVHLKQAKYVGRYILT